MRSSNVTLSALLIALSLTKAALVEVIPTAPPMDETLMRTLRETEDAESLIAIGERMAFSRTGIYELELIPRISDKLAFAIIDRRESILLELYKTKDQIAHSRRGRVKSCKKPPSALEVVPGVGAKLASHIETYIDLKN